MTMEYQCGKCKEVTAVFYKSMKEAVETDLIQCPHEGCTGIAEKIFSAPLGFGLYGDNGGYEKPSPTKRHSTKVVNEREGNRDACG